MDDYSLLISQFLTENKESIEADDWDAVFNNINQFERENNDTVANILKMIIVQNIPEVFTHLSRVPNDTFRDCDDDCFDTLYINCDIGDHAFMGTNVKKLTLGPNVERLSSYAFQGCALLEEVIIEGSEIDIGIEAFAVCKGLKRVIFKNPNAKVSLGSEAFVYCYNLEECEIPQVESISYHAFLRCKKLKHLSLPNKFNYGGDCFMGCNNLTIDYDGTDWDWGEVTAWEEDFNENPAGYKINYLKS